MYSVPYGRARVLLDGEEGEDMRPENWSQQGNMRLFFDREEVEESERVEDMDLEVGEETSSDATMYSHSVERFHLCLFHGDGFRGRGRNW